VAVEKSERARVYLEDAWNFFKRGVEELGEGGHVGGRG